MTRKLKIDNGIMVGSQGAEALGLPSPYPASPGRPGKYCLYVTRDQRLITFICCAEYVAKKFLDILLKGEEAAKTTGPTGEEDTIVCLSGITIRSQHLHKLVDYELSSKEEQWEMDDNSSRLALRMKNEQLTYAKPREEKVRTSKEEKAEGRPAKVSRDGLISIAQIAEELNMLPRDARAALRKGKVVKPEHGWAWSKNEVDEIKKILNNHK